MQQRYANFRQSEMLPRCVDGALRLRKLEARCRQLLRNVVGEMFFVLESGWHCPEAYVRESDAHPALLLPACLYLKGIKESYPAEPSMVFGGRSRQGQGAVCGLDWLVSRAPGFRLPGADDGVSRYLPEQ